VHESIPGKLETGEEVVRQVRVIFIPGNSAYNCKTTDVFQTSKEKKKNY